MLGLMQTQPLLVSVHPGARRPAPCRGPRSCPAPPTAPSTRTTYHAGRAPRRGSLPSALRALGVGPSDRVATLAWNGHRHLELYYAVSGMGSDHPHREPAPGTRTTSSHILNDAGSIVLCVGHQLRRAGCRHRSRTSPCVRTRGRCMADADGHAGGRAGAGPRPALLRNAAGRPGTGDYAWPRLDEDAGERALLHLRHHRAAQGRAVSATAAPSSTPTPSTWPTCSAFRATDRVMPVVPMFHVNGWGIPYAAPMAGASPGHARPPPGRGVASQALMNEERVTLSAGVPTVWMGLLQHLRGDGRQAGHPEAPGLRRLRLPGHADRQCSSEDYGVQVDHAWGMTETSPLGTFYGPKPEFAGLSEDRAASGCHTSRAVPIAGAGHADRGRPGPRPAVGRHDLRQPAGARPLGGAALHERGRGRHVTAEGWFATGDVATIDAHGMMEITDRTKDIVKSGGEWISSIQLENIAVGHPDVGEAAIVAAQPPEVGRAAAADRRRPSPAARWTPRPLPGAVCRARSRSGGSPDEVVVVDSLPHTATGQAEQAGACGSSSGTSSWRRWRSRAWAGWPGGAARGARPAAPGLAVGVSQRRPRRRHRRTGRAGPGGHGAGQHGRIAGDGQRGAGLDFQLRRPRCRAGPGDGRPMGRRRHHPHRLARADAGLLGLGRCPFGTRLRAGGPHAPPWAWVRPGLPHRGCAGLTRVA